MEGITERLDVLARTQPDKVVLSWVDPRGRVTREVTARELRAKVSAVASFVRHECGVGRGESVLLVYPPGLPFVFGFLGTMACGAVPVPVYPPQPNRLDRDGPALARVVENCGARIALTSTDYAWARRISGLTGLLRRNAGRWPQLRWYTTDRVRRGRAVEHRATPDEVALLQYTSGSTSDPKGVMITHANIQHQLDFNRRALQMGPDARAVMWVPQYHDFGLISGILSAAWGNLALWMMSPFTFLKRPAVWLSTMSQVRATHTAAPNFGYALALRKTTPNDRAAWDLSSVRVMMSAAEPVDGAMMDAFFDAFADTGLSRAAFCPAYGLAEHTVGVTVRGQLRARIDRRALARGRVQAGGDLLVVGCGRPDPDIEVRIVDPDTCRRLPAGRVGEIWVDSPSVAAGYLGRPQQTAAAFRAQLHGSDGTWLRTGDLGFEQDGEIVVAGRLKDLIIVRGRNLHPEDVESTIRAANDKIRPGGVVAFGLRGDDGTEGLAAAIELRDDVPEQAVQSVAATVCDEIVRVHAVTCGALHVGRRGLVLKTTSGKIRRQACAAQAKDGTLETRAIRCVRVADDPRLDDPPVASVAEPAAAQAGQDTARVVASLLAAQLELAPEQIDVHRPLTEFGLDSAGAVELAGQLSERFGHSVPDTVAFEHPTVQRLALYLDRSEAEPAPEPGPSGTDDEIAIVGLACRFAGAESAQALWTLLARGGDAIEPVPPERWSVEDWYDPEPATPGRMVTRWGGFVPGVQDYDAAFFGISDREARALDPQARLLLEVCAEALDHAGIPRTSVRGADHGVFVGMCGHDYLLRVAADPTQISAHSLTGTAHSTIAGRIAYWLGSHGPAMAVDTACSSSLVAVHLACQALRAGECRTAIAGGSNVVLAPEGTVYFSQAGAMSPTGRCRPFSANADGYVRSDGCGVVVLKPLSDARRDGDRVLAVLAGSSVNQDGQSAGLTAPNGEAQVSVLRRAWEHAGIDGTTLDYIECHGTGTPLGDPIEANAITTALGERQDRLPIGSVKSNIGHAEGAAGIAGLIKVVLSLAHQQLPPSLHADRLNQRIDWTRLELLGTGRPWPSSARPRWAGISSFGFGGTNAHLVVRDEPCAPQPTTLEPRRPVPLLLSAASEPALECVARGLAAHLHEHPHSITDVAHTLARRRTHERYRAAAVLSPSSPPSMVEQLEPRRAGPGLRVVFAFDSAAPRMGMGRDLADRWPVFAQALEQAAGHCQAFVPQPLREVLWAEVDVGTSPPVEEAVAGPAALCLAWALSRLWASWGIWPVATYGAGVGAIAAACFEGRVSLAEAAKRVATDDGNLGRADAPAPGPHLAEPTEPAEPLDPLDPIDPIDPIDPVDLVLELGPRGTLTARDGDPAVQTVASLPSGVDPVVGVLNAAAALWVRGADIDVAPLVPPGRLVDLPSYPWQRRRHWLEPPAVAARPSSAPCGVPIGLSVTDVEVWEQGLDIGQDRLWTQHEVDGVATLPAAGFIRALLATDEIFELRSLRLHEPLTANHGATLVQIVHQHGRLTLCSRSTAADDTTAWTQHASCERTARGPWTSEPPSSSSGAKAVDAAELYRALASAGLAHGPSFARVSELLVADQWARGQVPFAEHPPGSFDVAALDACLHVVAAAAGSVDGTWVPAAFQTIRLDRARLSGPLHAEAIVTERSAHAIRADLRITDDEGTTIGELLGIDLRPLQRQRATTTETRPDPSALPAAELRPVVWQLVRDAAAQALGIEPERVDMTASPLSQGLDSMMGLEMAEVLEEELSTELDPSAMISATTFDGLVDAIVDRIGTQQTGYALPIWDRAPDDWQPSLVQRAMVADSRWLPGGFVHSRASAIEGSMPPEMLGALWQQFTARHTLLRSIFDGDGEQMRCRHRPSMMPSFSVRDVADLDEQAFERELAAMVLTPIELSEQTCRATVWRRGEDRHVLQVDFHHVTYDAESMRGMLLDLAGLMTGSPAPLAATPSRHHGRFAQLERHWSDSDAGRQARAFWHQSLTDVPFHLIARDDDLVHRPAAEAFLQRSIVVHIDDTVAASFDSGATAAGGTANGALMAAWGSAVRQAIAGTHDPLAIGITTSLRHNDEMRALEGPVINCLPIVIPPGGESAAAMIPELMPVLEAARRHERYPFGSLLLELDRMRGHGWPAWCLDINLHIYELSDGDASDAALQRGPWRVSEVPLSHLPVVRATPLTLYVTRRSGRLSLQIRHTRALVSDDTADRLLRRTAAAVEAIARIASS